MNFWTSKKLAIFELQTSQNVIHYTKLANAERTNNKFTIRKKKTHRQYVVTQVFCE